LGIAQAFIGDIVSIVLFVVLVAGIMKVFQMAGDLREMKDILRDIKRNTSQVGTPLAAAGATAAPVAPGTLTPEELVRAVHAQKFTDDDDLSVLETIPPPRS